MGELLLLHLEGSALRWHRRQDHGVHSLGDPGRLHHLQRNP